MNSIVTMIFLSFRRAKNLKDQLVRAKLPSACEPPLAKGTYRYNGRKSCQICNVITEGDSFENSDDNRSFKNFSGRYNCNSEKVVYLLHEWDIKSTWKTINLVLNKKSRTRQIATLDVDGKKISNHEAIAEHMNTYFCNIGQDLNKKIPATQNPLLEGKYSVNPEGTTFHFQPVNSNQVASVLGKFKTSMGFGTDCIANHFLMIGLPVISDSLCDLFNLSLATGVFSDSWKIDRVVPVFKSGQTDDRSNCRPIAVLPVLSRIFEKN